MNTSPKHAEEPKIAVRKSAAEQIRDILEQPGIPDLHKIRHAQGLAECHLYNLPNQRTGDEKVRLENDFLNRLLRLFGPRDRELSPEQQKAALTETRELVEAAIEAQPHID